MVDHKMPFSRALLWILVSTLLISGSAFTGWLYFLHVRERRLHDDQYHIVAIIQSTPQSDALKTVYLAELLNLSLDQPINLYQFNVQEAVHILLTHPLIKSASVKKILPGTLFIHYEMRTPIAYVGDFSNTMVDEEGYLFPFRPFFTPKRLPTLYLGLEKEECTWGSCLLETFSLKEAYFILRQFEQLQQDNLSIKQLDMSQVQADSYGQRQIVLLIEEHSSPSHPSSEIYLRLSSDHYAQDLANFRTLQTSLFAKQEISLKKIPQNHPIIVDLRIPHLAFIKPGR